MPLTVENRMDKTLNTETEIGVTKLLRVLVVDFLHSPMYYHTGFLVFHHTKVT